MLPNVNIILGTGNIGAVTLSDDGIAGLLLTGSAVTTLFALDTVYILSSSNDLAKYGITAANNPLIYKEVTAFYLTAGEGAELHLLAQAEATTLTVLCGAPLNKLIDSAAGRLRVIGVNINTSDTYSPTLENTIDADVVAAIAVAQAAAESYMDKISPFVVLLPALAWTGEVTDIYQPNSGSNNCVSVVMASDGIYGDSLLYSAAIGQVLGRLAASAVNVSVGRVKDGSIASAGYLMDGNTPEEDYSLWPTLHDAGYIFYRTFIGKNGYYLNGDSTATASTDDYSRLSLTRTIQKALVICYRTYIDEILDNVLVDADTGKLSQPVCKAFEQSIIRAINTNMIDEISGFTAYVNPDQDLITSGALAIQCKVIPTALLRQINVDLSFNNPYSND